MEENIYHIIPADDLQPHTEDVYEKEGKIMSNCSCCPHIEQEGAKAIVFHNRFDGEDCFKNDSNG